MRQRGVGARQHDGLERERSAGRPDRGIECDRCLELGLPATQASKDLVGRGIRDGRRVRELLQLNRRLDAAPPFDLGPYIDHLLRIDELAQLLRG